MKIVSWNVNGIRACLGKNLQASFDLLRPDLFCVQETKANPEQLEDPTLGLKRTAWSSAEKKGYSGTAIFTNHTSFELDSGMQLAPYDREGRCTIAKHSNFTLLNLYFPNGAASPERHQFKMRFLQEFLPWAKKLEKKSGPLVICGDYNIAHQEVDIHDPIRNKDSSGFLPEERDWMTKFLESGFIDTFRHCNPHAKDEYSWWSFRQQSRQRNKGWRIDYICVSETLKKAIKEAKIHQNVLGSDHCPISLTLDL